MNKKRLLYLLAIPILFIGGFFAGVTFTHQSMLSEPSQGNKQTTPLSSKNPQPKQLPEKGQQQSKVIIGYVQDFHDPRALDLTNLTHVIFSFAHPTKDGELLLNGDMALNNLRNTVLIAHAENKKIMLAIGGWYHINGGESYHYFKSAIANQVSRTKLVKKITSLVEREQLDGIDIDFEHPRSQEDAKNLAIFIKELHTVLHDKNKELSVAVNAKIHSVSGTEIQSVVYETSMFKYVDHVNIMAYDGQWDGAYNAANLSPFPYTENIVNYWSTLFDTHQISKGKLVLGVPFYAQPEDQNSKQVSYATIIQTNPNNAIKDSASINGTTYYYNGPTTMKKKTQLALENGFGGMMLWEAGHDANGEYSLSTTISQVLKDNRESVSASANES